MKTHCVFPIALLALRCAFLNAAEWHQEKDARWRELPNFSGASAGFTLLKPEVTGVKFTNVISELGIARNRVVENGAGVALGDFDGDGLPDIFACSIESPSRLFRNLGNLKFRDETMAAGLPDRLTNIRGAVFADINSDGHLDLLVSGVFDGVRCFVNVGGKFVERTDECGLRHGSGATTLALADIDGNGTLDLYVTNYRTNDIRDVGRLAVKTIGGKTVIPPDLQSRFTIRRGDVVEFGEPDQLYLNDGKGHFTAVAWTDGAFLDVDAKPLTEPPRDWGLTATFRDVNGDGAPDLYVCNDYWTPDRFWINDGKGRFRAAAPFTLRKTPFSSMGVDFADVNRDGILDFFCVEMLARDPRMRKRQMFAEKMTPAAIGLNADAAQVFQNTLFVGRGDGTFAEAACFAGVEATDWSWSPLFLDIDLDGYEDLVISAGHFHDVQDLDAGREIQRRQHSWRGYTNEIARQEAFTKELLENYRVYPPLNLPIHAFRNGGDLHFNEMTADWGFTNAAVRHGMALADLDGDGDLDLVVNCLNSALEIYRNEAQASRVAVRLKGLPPNVEGVGAKIVFRSAIGVQQKEIVAGGSYLSASEPLAVFGFRSAANLEITWRSRKKSVVSGFVGNRIYEIVEPENAPLAVEARQENKLLFEDVSDRIKHIHEEIAQDDFQQQPTLPFKLSQRGPSCAWVDLNGDGHEDLVIDAAGAPEVFYSDGKGNFARETNAVVVRAEFRWRTAVALGCFKPPNEMALFVGGEIQLAQYPLAKPSVIMRRERGEWKVDATNSAIVSSVGIVNGAVWSDLNGDGISELILASEWGPIRVFRNNAGVLEEITSELGLADAKGLWRGIATADVNGDGRLDLVAANWGLNSPWRATKNKPFVAYYGEFTQPGRVEFIETEWDRTSAALTARRPLATLGSAMPFLFEQFASFKDFAEAPIALMLGSKISAAKQVSVNTLASTVFLNRGSKFEAVELPLEAQLSPAFSVNGADFDCDGNVDIFLSQSFMAMHPDYARQDGGRGLLLKGDGSGRFTAVSGDSSGLKIYGEQRAAAVCDFDGDGRPDLAVMQNGAETKLYRNVRGKPGVRVKLIGPTGNPLGVGAQIWSEHDQKRTAVQEVQAGSGYLARDSAIKIIPVSIGGSVHVRWPGGANSSVAIGAATNEITIVAPR